MIPFKSFSTTGSTKLSRRKSVMTTLEMDRCKRRPFRSAASFLLGLLVFFASAVSTTKCFVITRVGNERSSLFTPTQPYKKPHTQRCSSAKPYGVMQRTSSSAIAASTTSTTTTGGGSDLQDLKTSIDIVEVVESYNLPKFRRTGTGAMACCPFHDDTNPSMSIDTTRQMYKCFSCGEGGDVFRFVQQYSSLQGQDGLTFGQVVQVLDTQFGDGTFKARPGEGKSSIPPEQREKERIRKERCLLANEVAASFFAVTLTQASFGAARLYLRSRGVSGRTIRRFAIGFASGGKNDLTKQLQALNFTAAEVVDAGLAIVSRHKKGAAPATNATSIQDNLTYDDIVDKFNNRIMVPIVSESGKEILGFGGRTISSEKDEILQPKFKAPKYLNSPETPVFSKSNILFGRSFAAQAIHEVTSHSSQRPTIVLVEGYMDVIALWEAGYHAAAATMGTAISQHQLDCAAKTVSGSGGRVVLCLDSDKAGQAAMERLCSNGMVAASAKKFKVDVLIASLPGGLKDPGDYASMYQSSDSFVSKFEKEVIDAAEDWMKWYTSSIIRQYSKRAPRGARNSFSEIVSRVAEFIGSTMDTADRTKAALDISHLLAELLKTDRNSTEISKTVQIQLEADLIDLAARNSYSRNALSRRVEEVSMITPESKESKITMSSLLKGNLLSAEGDTITKGNTRSPARSDVKHFKTRKRPIGPKRITTMRRPKREEASLTPHFSGFEFKHKSDAAWVTGSTNAPKWKSSNSNSLLLGSPDADALSSNPFGQAVYFNSADFNGNQFISDEALDAGYERGQLKPAKSVVTSGVASLIQRDHAHAAESLEDVILRTLLKSQKARRTAKEFLESRSTVYEDAMAWSCTQNRWLFDTLVFKESTFRESTSLSETRSQLLDQEDVPLGSFHILPNSLDQTAVTDKAKVAAEEGVLEKYFTEPAVVSDDGLSSLIDENLPDLQIQEVLGEFLWTTSFLRVEKIRDEYRNNPLYLPTDSSEDNATESILQLNNTRLEDGQETNHCSLIALHPNETRQSLDLAGDLRDAINSAKVLKQSSIRITSNVMDESLTTGVGQLSLSKRNELVGQVGQHVRTVTHSQDQLEYISAETAKLSDLVSSEEDDESYEERLEQVAEEWGDWGDEGYVWSSAHTDESTIKAMAAFRATESPDQQLDLEDFEDDESLEDFNARIALEYNGWDESI